MLLALVAPLAAAAPDWSTTLDRVNQAVVSIRVTGTRDFDTEGASVSQGTGFIVDAERGIVLTNRHMVHAGPVVAEAVFLDNEEVDLVPIYRDPIHDFGFYRFDPGAVKYMPVVALPLAPDGAKVGLDIRVVGNDAGEKLSILDGTLARLDRNAPDYGDGNYNDWNTFYYQAASNTSGGSSGSPVVDINGRVVALNAGGSTRAASSFYLPLHRVVPAFEALVAGKPIDRGTIGTVFTFTPYDELSRLGLTADSQATARKDRPAGTGLLVVDEVSPGTGSDGKLLPGDILLRVGGQAVADFVVLEALLDSAVGQPVAVDVERGGKPIHVEIPVGDLAAVSPRGYLEVSRAILHDLSYQVARAYHRPIRGVYVAMPGYMFSTAGLTAGAIITAIDGEPTPDLDAIEKVLQARGDGQRLRVRWEGVADPLHQYETVAVMDRRWFPMRRCTRDDTIGEWPCVDALPPPPAVLPPPPESLLVPVAPKPGSVLASSLVYVDFDVPYPTAGVNDLNYVGVGTVVDAERGLVLVDRDTVPVALGDMTLTFAGAVRVPGQLVYLHPVHGFAIVHYDPAALGRVPVTAVEWADDPLEEGDPVWQVGLDSDRELVLEETEVAHVDLLPMGISGTPRFRETNANGIDIASAKDSLGGVLCDKKGRVYALWASYLDPAENERAFHGLSRTYLDPILGPLRAGKEPVWRSPGFEVFPLSLADARDRGLSDARVRQVVSGSPRRPRVLEIARVWGGTPAAAVLRDTDVLLAIDGEPVTDPDQLEALTSHESLRITWLRDGKEMTADVSTVPLDGHGVDRVVSWAGLLAHEPHLEVSAQQGTMAPGVYVGWLWYGSPASRYGVRPTSRITAVDDIPTPTIDAFAAAVAALHTDRAPVRLSIIDLEGREKVATLRLDLDMWRTEWIERTPAGWQRRPIEGAP
jgi:S1-C subfamily serine protease